MDPAVVTAFNYWMEYKEKQTVALKVYCLECYMLLHFPLFLARVQSNTHIRLIRTQPNHCQMLKVITFFAFNSSIDLLYYFF